MVSSRGFMFAGKHDVSDCLQLSDLTDGLLSAELCRVGPGANLGRVHMKS